MIKVNYTELDGPAGPTCRLEASGHAGYAPAGQDIVCAGASTLMQTLCALLAGEEGTKSGAWDEPDGPRLAVTAAAPQKPWVEGAFEFAKAGFALLAERYPDHVRFADLSGRGEQSMVDLQMFAAAEATAASGGCSKAISRMCPDFHDTKWLKIVWHDGVDRSAAGLWRSVLPLRRPIGHT